jgi:hypothetical protein
MDSFLGSFSPFLQLEANRGREKKLILQKEKCCFEEKGEKLLLRKIEREKKVEFPLLKERAQLMKF